MAAAAKATGNVVFEGDPGTVVPAGTKVERSDGTKFSTLAAAVVGDAGEVTVRVEAARAGKKGESEPGEVFTVLADIDGLSSEAMVSTDGLRLAAADGGKAAAADDSDDDADEGEGDGGDDEGDDAAARVQLTVMLNGGSLVQVPAEILDAHVHPSGATLYDLRARLPDGRTLELDRVPQRRTNDVAIAPFWDDALAPQLEV